jgi:hypothetical protein
LPGRIRSVSFYSSPVKPHGSLSHPQGTAIGTYGTQADSADTVVKVLLDTSYYGPIIRKAMLDSADAAFDTQVIAFCAAAADTGNVIRFGAPVLVVRYRALCTDTAQSAKTSQTLASAYTDYSVYEKDNSPAADAHRSSMETALFTRIQVDLSPLWNAVAAADTYSIVHQAAVALNTDTSVIEPGSDTLQVLFGISSQSYSTKLSTFGFRDSLIGLVQSGRLKTVKVARSPQAVSLPVSIFLQYMSETDARADVVYLYLFSTGSAWGNIRWKPAGQITLNALFSNPKK